MFKQTIIVRKDLNMSPGKMAAQVSHASMAFLSHLIRDSTYATIDSGNFEKTIPIKKVKNKEDIKWYNIDFNLEKDLFEEWFLGSFTKTILEAKNKNQLLKAIEIAKSLNMEEGKDYFPIYDNCYTELTPEETIDGIGRTLTCIGFKPMKNETIDLIGKKYQLYKK